MADNVVINTGTGPTIVTDQIGTAHYQVIKIALGSADTAAMLPVGQQAMAASLPVAIANNQSTLDVAVVSFTPSGTQNVAVVSGTVSTVLAMPVLVVTASANPLVVAGSVSVINTPTITASQGGTWNVATVSTVLALPVVTITASANPIVVNLNGTGNVNVATVTTVLAMPVLSATGVTVASLATGTVNVVSMPVLSAANVTIASVTTGTMNVINVLSATGVLLAATTAVVGAFVTTAHGSSWNAYAVNTASSASVILKTSGAHTLYVTDLLVSVDVPGNLTLMSAATTKLTAYFATKGGMVMNMTTPLILNSAQSLTFVLSASGSCAAYAAGITVT